MSIPDEVRDPDHDWLGCEAMLSVPPFGLRQADAAQQVLPPTGEGRDAEADDGAR